MKNNKSYWFLFLRVVIIFTFTISCITQLLANDTYISAVGGTMKVYTGEHNSIQMKSEIVILNVYYKYFEVEAKFIFKNHGTSTSVIMGFPEYGSSMDKKCPSNFSNYETTVNGQIVESHREYILSGQIDNEYFYNSYWVKEVQFDNMEEKVVVVRYTSELGSSDDYGRGIGFNSFCVYKFTGGNWFGVVEESILKVKFKDKSFLTDNDIVKRPEMIYKDDYYIFKKNNWQAEYEFRLYFNFYDDYISFLTKEIDNNINLKDNLLKRANAYSIIENYNAALYDLFYLTEMKTNYDWGYYSIGEVYYELRNYYKAIEYYSKAITIDPDYPDYYLNRAVTYARLDENDMSEKDYLKYLSLKPKNPAVALGNLGWVYFKRNIYDTALKYFKSGEGYNPQSGDIKVGISLINFLLKDSLSFIKSFDKLLSLIPELTDYDNFILTLESRGYFYSEYEKEHMINMVNYYKYCIGLNNYVTQSIKSPEKKYNYYICTARNNYIIANIIPYSENNNDDINNGYIEEYCRDFLKNKGYSDFYRRDFLFNSDIKELNDLTKHKIGDKFYFSTEDKIYDLKLDGFLIQPCISLTVNLKFNLPANVSFPLAEYPEDEKNYIITDNPQIKLLKREIKLSNSAVKQLTTNIQEEIIFPESIPSDYVGFPPSFSVFQGCFTKSGENENLISYYKSPKKDSYMYRICIVDNSGTIIKDLNEVREKGYIDNGITFESKNVVAILDVDGDGLDEIITQNIVMVGACYSIWKNVNGTFKKLSSGFCCAS